MPRLPFTALAAVVLLAAHATAQIPSLGSAQQVTSEAALLEALGVGAYSAQQLQLPAQAAGHLEVAVELGGQQVTLSLTPHSMRSPELFSVVAQGDDGSLSPVAVGPIRTLRGVVEGVAGSRVAASLGPDGLSAVAALGPGLGTWGIQPAASVQPLAAPGLHVVYATDDLLDRGETCGGALIADGVAPPPPSPSNPGGYQDAGDALCQIACDADVEFYNSNGSSVNETELDIEHVLNVVETIYEVGVDVTYEITTIIVRTSQPDPYTGNGASSLLNQFRSEWNSNQQGVQRDIAHLFTGRNIDGGTIGIAWLSVICSNNQGYGLSQSKFSGSIASRAALTAHELGHNWSAGHCDSNSDCRIMCSGLGGCGSITSFAPVSVNQINNKKNSSGCLSVAGPDPAPSLALVSPATIGPLGSDAITLTGDDFYSAASVNVGGTILNAAQFQIVNDETITFTAPAATSLGNVNVTVTGASGNSATLSYAVAAIDPPTLMVPPGIFTSGGGGGNAVWTFAGSPNATVYFLINVNSSANFTYKGFSVLNTPFPAIVMSSDAVGVGQLLVPVTPALSIGTFYTVFSQAAFFAPQITGVSPVGSTLVL